MSGRLRIKIASTIYLASCLCVTPFTVSAHPEDQNLPSWAKPVAAWPVVSASVKQSIQNILAEQTIKKTIESLKADEDLTLKQNIALSEIPAPPFNEQKKAQAFKELMITAGITDAYIDQEGNAIGIRKGSGNGPLIVLDAHLDTVFPLETDLKVVQKMESIMAPA